MLNDTGAHHQNAVRQGHRLRLIVRHVQNGKTKTALQVLDLKTHLLAEMRVQAGQRLVEQHDVGPDHQRTRQCDPLLAATREIIRTALRRRQQIGVAQRLFGARHDFGIGQLAHAQGEGHVLEHRQMRPDREGLKHHAEIALLGRQVILLLARRQQLVTDPDFTLIEIVEAGHHAQGRGLAATRWAQHGDALTLGNIQIQAVHRRHAAKAFADVPEFYIGHERARIRNCSCRKPGA